MTATREQYAQFLYNALWNDLSLNHKDLFE